ncbi:hypothetical protein TTHERM_00997760 (macronuclear) [Tetrahymena thermophila SB210]|uniref:Uncharacterized protein n=1 Tax=Tetrahymena thermophila (strain SB210) TaxID=312017 RepID=Q23QY5_TETTS|nr:hypothetical protein TTHERM_00997760 [Tetrahymena thermophila SB210]EAR98971.2 hypothetical protein TTHERM_00997760 [Tetrahymena thermophila SB210]|eukprot:XP_001019216.2 hypothetical protein TTHERM_00997760 [Tetrahymena thermophila SB210]
MKKGQRLKEYKLSEALKSFPQKDSNLINLSFKNISVIDNVPKKYHAVESLDLRGNILTSIKGVTQFQKLVHLNLATNNILNLENLLFLKDLQQLRWLSLEDNPIKDQINYVYTIITLLPNLQFLDGAKISESLKKESEESLKQQDQMLDVLLKNYIELIQLNDALKKIRLHSELKTEYNFNLDTPPFCIEKYQRYFKLQRIFDNQDPDICVQFKISLLNDAHLLLSEPQSIDSLNEAFEQLRQKQIDKKLELIDKIEQIIQEQNNEFFKQKLAPHSQNVYKSSRSMSASKKSQLNKSNSSSLLRSSSHKKIGVPQQNQENIEQTYQNKNIHHTFNTNNSQMNLSIMSNGGNQSRRQLNSSNQKLQHQTSSQSYFSTSRINNSLNTMNKFTKLTEFANHPSNCLKLRNSDKDTLICQLSESLNAKIAEYVKLEETNQRLRVEINDQCKQADNINSDLQNQVLFKEEQIKNCQEQMKAMEQSLKDTKQKLNVLIFQNYEMERCKSNLDKSEQIIQSMNAAFQYQEFLDEKESFARDYYNKRVLQFGLNCLKFATQQTKKVNSFQQKIENKFMHNQGAFLFKKWIEFTIKGQRVKHQQAVQNNQIVTTFFKQWKNNAAFSKNIQKFKLKQQKRIELETYCKIKDFARGSKKLKVQDSVAVKFHQKKLKKVAFQLIKLFYQKYNIVNKKELNAINRQAQNHYTNYKKKVVLFFWKNYIKQNVLPMKEKSKKSLIHFNSKILQKSFYRWTILRTVRLQNEQKAELAAQRKQKKFLQKLLWRWKDDYHKIYVKKKTFSSKYNFQLKIKYFKALCQAKTIRENKIAKQLSLQSKIDHKLIIKVIKSLKMNVSNNKKIEKRANQIISEKNQQILQKYFKGVKQYLQEQKIQKERVKKIELKIQSKYLNIMKKKADRQANRKAKSIALKSQKVFKLNQNFQKAFQFWKVYVAKQKRQQRLLSKAEFYHKQRVFHYLILGIKDNNIQQFKRKIIEQELMLKSLQDACNQNMRYANEADNKQIDYINKLDILSQNIDFLKSEITEKDMFIQELKLNISQKNEQIENLQTEHMITSTENKELLKKLNILDNELVNKSSKYEQMIFDLKEQYSQLNMNIQQMQSDFEIKERGYKEQYGALSIKNASQDNYIAKLEQLKVELEERCTSAEILSQNQKNENQDLLRVISSFEDERDQYKQKIEECLKLIEESSAIYENKLLELKEEKNNLDTENIVLKEKNHRQENEILDLKNDLRRLEYQVELMVVEQHKQTIQFIDNLSNNNNPNNINTNQVGSNNSTANKFYQNFNANQFKVNQNNQYDSIQQPNYETLAQVSTPIQTPKAEYTYESAINNNYVSSRAIQSIDERQLQQQFVNIQDFLRPRRQDISPLKSYLTSRREKSQQKEEHVYVLPQTQKAQTSKRISITSPSQFENKAETSNFYLKSQPQLNQTQHYQIQNYLAQNSQNSQQTQKFPQQNLIIDSIQKEVRSMKSNTSALKLNIERRLQNLNQNLDSDIITLKQQRLNSQNEDFEQYDL